MPPIAASGADDYSCTNTLVHYLAMHDDLYCSLIYQQFSMNPLMGAYGNARLIDSLGNIDSKLATLLD